MQFAQRILRSLYRAYEGWSSDGASLLAAAVAYYVAVAFFPMLLILLSLLGVFMQWTDSGKDAQAELLSVIEEQLSPALSSQVESVLASVEQNASLGGPLGVLALLVAAIAIFTQFDAAFDRIWNTREGNGGVWASVRRVLFVRLKAFLMLLALGALVVGVFLVGIALSAVQSMTDEVVPLGIWTDWGSQLLISFLLNAAVFTLIYRYVPKKEVPWQAALSGGILAAVIWEIGRIVLSTYVIGQKYSSAYGLVGAFMAIMLWGYYAASVIFFGAEYAQAELERSASARHDKSSD